MFSQLRISAKLALLVGLMAAAMLAIGAYGLYALQDAKARQLAGLKNARQTLHAIDSARAAEVNFRMQVQEFKNILLRGHDPADLARHTEGFRARNTAVQKQFDEAAVAMKRLSLPVDGLEETRLLHVDLARQYEDALRLLEPGKADGPQLADRAVRGKDRPLEQKFSAVATGLEKFAEQDAARAVAAAEADARSAMLALFALALGAVAAAAAVGLQLARGITTPIREAVDVAQSVAAGNLTRRIATDASGEAGDLLRALARMSDGLRALVGQVTGGARTVADTSAQIAQGNVDLSQRTEEQAGSLEETAGSLEELTSTVAQNAQNARQASEFAHTASDVARKGGQAVSQVVTKMDGIATSSRRISEIIGVIDGIAFQTNILALNAAVEAARAGDQGRGFAVVASEVRALAQRSAEAAKEIKALITDSVQQVEEGTRMVGQAGQTMNEIVASVKKVSDFITEIAAASQEQSVGIEHVNTAVSQMDTVVQQNASLVEEAAAATEAMKAQAATLLELVSRFQIDASDAAPTLDLRPVASLPPRATAAPPSRLDRGAHKSPRLGSTPSRPAPGKAPGQWEEF